MKIHRRRFMAAPEASKLILDDVAPFQFSIFVVVRF